MQKLIAAFRATPTDAARVRLQTYIRKHPMAVCLLMPEESAWLRAQGFTL